MRIRNKKSYNRAKQTLKGFLKTIMAPAPDGTIVGLIFLSNYHLGLKNGPSALKADKGLWNYLQERVQGRPQGLQGSPPPTAPPSTTSSWPPSTNSFFFSVSLFSTPSQFFFVATVAKLLRKTSLWSHLSNRQIWGNFGAQAPLSSRCRLQLRRQ